MSYLFGVIPEALIMNNKRHSYEGLFKLLPGTRGKDYVYFITP